MLFLFVCGQDGTCGDRRVMRPTSGARWVARPSAPCGRYSEGASEECGRQAPSGFCREGGVGHRTRDNIPHPAFSLETFNSCLKQPTLRSDLDIGSENPVTTTVTGFFRAIFQSAIQKTSFPPKTAFGEGLNYIQQISRADFTIYFVGSAPFLCF